MVKKSKKSKSKRMPLRKKYKILKKVKEHHKKKAKQAKLQERKGRKVEKDPGIPSQWPFREQELANLERRRAAAIEQMEKAKEEKKRRRLARKNGDVDMDAEGDDLAALATAANQRGDEFEEKVEEEAAVASASGPADNSLRAFHKEVKKVVDASDVIIHVLDARDPVGCRCREVERLVMNSDATKRIVLVLNKIDLVPQEVVQKWLKYLRRELPTVAFKCSTQSQRRNLGQRGTSKSAAPSSSALQTSESLGADNLLQLLKNYSRNQKLKTSITVGIVGLPNVGKSSLINSLKRVRAASVGSTPGVTKVMQEVHLDKHVKLLDSPGIVFSTPENSGVAAALCNAVKIEKLDDPVAVVGDVLKVCSKESLMSVYKIPVFADADEFVRQVAITLGKLKKGGVPNTRAAAKMILNDWNEGKIPYYTLPPEGQAEEELAESVLMSEWRKEFDVDEVFASEESAVISALPTMDDGRIYNQKPSSGPPVVNFGDAPQEVGGQDAMDE